MQSLEVRAANPGGGLGSAQLLQQEEEERHRRPKAAGRPLLSSPRSSGNPPSPQHPAIRHPQNLTIPRFRISKPNGSLAAANYGWRWLPGFRRGLPAPQTMGTFPPHSTCPPAPFLPHESSSIPPRSVISCPAETPPLTPNNKYQHFLSSTDTGVPSFGCAPPRPPRAPLPPPQHHGIIRAGTRGVNSPSLPHGYLIKQ